MSDDIPRGYGSLGGEGTDHHDQIKTTVADDGIVYKLACDRCGRGLLLTVEWPELVYMAKRKIPGNNSWYYNGQHGMFMPSTGCTACGEPVRVGITPDECGRHLNSAVGAGKVSAAAVQNYAMQIEQQGR